MPDCKAAEESLVLFSLDELAEDKAAELAAHLDTCERCRSRLESIRSGNDLLAETLNAVEPGSAFEDRVLSALKDAVPAQPARPSLRARLLPLAAAAAVIVAAVGFVFHANRPAAALLEGTLAGGGRKIRAGAEYVTAEATALELPDETRALLAKDTRFSVGKSLLHIENGSCYVRRPRPGARPAVLLAGGVTVEVRQAELFFSAGNAPAARTALLDLFMARAWAGEDIAGGSALVIVFSGSARVRVAQNVVKLDAGEFLFADQAAPGARGVQNFIDGALTQISAVREKVASVTPSITRYAGVVSSYDRHLVELRAQAVEAGPEQQELRTRIALVEKVKAAHETRLAGFNETVAALRTPELAAAERRLARLQQAKAGYGRAAAQLLEY